MPRERKGFRDQLENIIAAHPQGEQMSVKEVAKYCGRDERTVAKQFPFVGKGRMAFITRTTLAREMVAADIRKAALMLEHQSGAKVKRICKAVSPAF